MAFKFSNCTTTLKVEGGNKCQPDGHRHCYQRNAWQNISALTDPLELQQIPQAGMSQGSVPPGWGQGTKGPGPSHEQPDISWARDDKQIVQGNRCIS